MRKTAAFLVSFALVIGFLTIPAEADDMGKIGEYQSISIGGTHTAAIKPDGSLWVWGRNDAGQVGNGGEADAVNANGIPYQSTPVKVLENVVSVSCGSFHTAAIQGDGSLWVWGRNNYGQIGNGGSGDASYYDKPIQTTPIKVLDDVAAVSCGDDCTAAIKTDGALWMWGGWGNSYGSTPAKIMDGIAAVSVDGGNGLYSVVKKDGTLLVWGLIDEERNGGYVAEYVKYTDAFKIAGDVASVSCSGSTVAFVKNDGTIWIWSSNSYGDRGDGTMDRYFLTEETLPVQVQGLSSAVSVSCGKSYTHIAAVLADGSLWMWGDNWFGQLGIGHTGNDQRSDGGGTSPVQTVPVKVMDQVSSVFCGSGNTAVIKDDGTLWTWGDNAWNALGYQGGNMRFRINDSGWMGMQTTPKQVTDFAMKPSGSTGAVQPGTPPAPAVDGFTDVAADAYYAAPVAWALEKGITTGATPTAFSPGQDCTNAQILTFLWRAYGEPEPTIANPFTNSIPEAYAKAAVWAYEKGMVSGTAFDVDKPCTRAMAVTYLWQAAGSPMPSVTAGFTDVPSGAFYAPAAAWAVEAEITKGTNPDGTMFTPDEVCNRGQIVTFLHRNLA